MAVSSPVIISVSIGAVIVLSVALVTIVRWASRKPSTQLPPPRSAALLSPYWANQQRYSTHLGGGVPDVYDEERKLTGKGSGVFNPYAEYTGSNVSDSSLYRGSKTPDGDRTPNSGVSFGHENVGTQSEHLPTPPLQPNELGEISLNSPNPPRQRPTSLQFVNGSPASRPAGSFGPNGSTFATVGGGAPQAAATDPQSTSDAPPSAFSHMHPSPPRPFSTSSRSRHSIAGPPIAQPPPSFYQTKQDRRASRMSMLSTYSSSGYTYDPRRSSVTSMIRGPPHKSNMQIVLPAPLAPTAAASASGPGIGYPGNNIGNAHDAEDSAFRRNQRRHSRVDLWTETNNIARSKSPVVPLADLSAADSGSRRNRRPSQGSERSGRSLELAHSGQFTHMQPPPPLPAASSRSLLTSSGSATPNSSSSALPAMSSTMTTPQRSMGSSEIVHEKHPSSSDAHSTSTLNNAVVDDSKPPPPPQPQNVVKSDNLPTIPSLPPIEPITDI